jgi:multidrug efflux pump
MDDYARRIEDLFKTIPEVERYFVVIGFPTVSQMRDRLRRLKPWDERDRKCSRTSSPELQPKFAQIPGIQVAFASNPPLARPERRAASR